jgi:integrase
MTTPPRINRDRLLERLATFNRIGALPGGGNCRLALSDEDRAGRDLLVEWMRELSLAVTIDAIGNIIGDHPIGGRELRALRRLQRETPKSIYVFVSERLAPLSVAGYQRMVARAGEAAGFPFLVHSHMLRHSCGYKLANDGQDTRAIQHYLGHKSINSTVRYTALAPDRFRGFWKD